MAVERITEMRKQTIGQLMEYRRSCALVRNREEGYRQARAWVRAIARVRRVLKAEEPEKERFMTRLFGLEHPVPQRRTARRLLLALAQEMNCSEATLYNWRAEIVELTLYAAIEAGLFQPFSAGKGGRARKKAL